MAADMLAQFECLMLAWLAANCHCYCVCSIAVLDGGLPAWLAAGYQTDESSVSEDQLEAAVKAARQPPAMLEYQAHLQVSSLFGSPAGSLHALL